MSLNKTINSLDNSQSVASTKQLGRYQIINEVGRGATAIVFKAYDPQLDRFIAIKVLRDALAKDENYRNAFIKEARLAAQLTHPAIVTIFDVGIAEQKPYIAMELLEGLTLDEILKSQGKLNLKTTLTMCSRLCSGLSYAHKQGVVHRDIKPANIVVLKDKKTVKLTDFGIAQLNDSLGNADKQTDKVLGTPEYMSPEQILGQPLDARSDLYSFGVLIFQLLTGNTPFSAQDLGVLFKKIVKDKPPQLELECLPSQDKVKDNLNDLIRKLLQKNAHKRYANAAMVTAELRQIGNQLKSQNTKPSKLFVSLKLQWTATMAALMFVAMCISLTVVYWVQNSTLTGITSDYGRSIANMIAYQVSEPILLNDNIALKAVVNESSKNLSLKGVSIMDLDNSIIASHNEQNIGEQFSLPHTAQLKQTIASAKVYQRQGEDNGSYFDIEMPITYANKTIAHLYLSFDAMPRNQAAKTTLVTMLFVMMIALAFILIITLLLAKKTSLNFSRVTQGLNKMSAGRFDARLTYYKNDEVGQLYEAFNRLAALLESKVESASTKQNDKSSAVADRVTEVAKNVAKIEVNPVDTLTELDESFSENKYNKQITGNHTVELDIKINNQ